MMESKVSSTNDVIKNLSNLLKFFTNETKRETKESLIGSILRSTCALLKKSITMTSSSTKDSCLKCYIHEKKIFIGVIEFFHALFKEIETKCHPSILFINIEREKLFDELILCLVYGLEDCAYHLFNLSSVDADYEIIVQESFHVLLILSSDSRTNDQKQVLSSSILAQLIQVILLYIKSSHKIFSKLALALLRKLLGGHGVVDDWRQFFPGIFTCLFMTITGASKNDSSESGLSSSMNSVKGDQHHQTRTSKTIYEACLGLLKLIHIVCDESVACNHALLIFLRATNEIQSSKLSLLQRLENEENQLATSSIKDELSKHLPSMFTSIDAFIQWRVDLLQRLGRYLPLVIRLATNIDQEFYFIYCFHNRTIQTIERSETTISVLASKRLIVAATVSLLLECSRFLGSRSSTFFALVDFLICYVDDADRQTQSLSKDGWKKISASFRIDKVLQREWLAVKQQITATFLTNIKSLSSNNSTSDFGLSDKLRSILSYGQILLDDIGSIFLSTANSFIPDNMLKLYMLDHEDIRGNNSHYTSKAVGDDVRFQLVNRYYTFISNDRGLWLPSYQLLSNLSTEDNKQLRRLAMMLGRGGALGALIDCIERCNNLYSIARQDYLDCMADVRDVTNSILAASNSHVQDNTSSLLSSPYNQKQIPWTNYTSKKLIEERELEYAAKIKELAAAWRIGSYAVVGCFELVVQSDASSQANICQYCKKHNESLSRCGRCKIVWYCSTDHQRADWSQHKTKCHENQSSSSQPQHEELLHYQINDPYDILSSISTFHVKLSHQGETLVNRVACLAIDTFRRYLQDITTMNPQLQYLCKNVLLILLDVMGNVSWILCKLFDEHARNILFAILVLAVNDEHPILSRSAISTIHRISLCMNYPSVSGFIGQNLDRIIDEITRVMRVDIYNNSNHSEQQSNSAYRILEVTLDTLDAELSPSTSIPLAIQDAVAMVQNMLLTTLTSVDTSAAIGLTTELQV